VSFLVVCVHGQCCLISLAAYTLAPLPSGYAYGGPTHDYSNKCECSTVGYSLVSACVECQGQKPFSCVHIMSSSQFPGAYGSAHALAGLNMWPTAHIYSTSFTVSFGVENLLHLTLNLVHRFPNPVPDGIRVPHWAILDVTVCLKSFFNSTVSTVITTHSRTKTIGMLMSHMPLVVSIVSLMFSFLPSLPSPTRVSYRQS
jgi:hypothetical protein